MSPRAALLVLIVASALIRLIPAFDLGLGNDEAYHFLYAAHPALSYYDHPPMMAWVEMAGVGIARPRRLQLGVADWFYRAFRGLDLAAGPADSSILRRLGRFPRGLCAQHLRAITVWLPRRLPCPTVPCCSSGC